MKRLENIKKENEASNWQPEPIEGQSTIDDFAKLDIRVGTILECQKVPKSDKLLQFKIDDGLGGRTILSGIAKSYPDPQELVGLQVLFVANFPTRKMMGLESQGMVTSVSKKVANGSRVG